MTSELAMSPRRSLKPQQSETVTRLLDAALALLEEIGHEALTIRLVAGRAGVSPATAYTYFSSKDHLFAELFWRHLDLATEPELTGGTTTERLQETLRHIAGLVASSPALAAAANKSLLGTDPEVERLRLSIGSLWLERCRRAIGADADPMLLRTLTFALSGALLEAGMGVLAYADLADHLEAAAAVIMRSNA